MSDPDDSALVSALRPFGGSIYAQMSALAREHDAIDLSQGFAGEDGPAKLRELAARAFVAGPNQYVDSRGTAELRAAIARYVERFGGISVDPGREVVVSSGAQSVLCAAIFGLIEPGDEVVVVEPYYNPIVSALALAGATLRFVATRPPDFALPEDELRQAFSSKTRAIFWNSPNNPTGTLMSRAELELIAELCNQHDAYAIADEVYERLVFDGAEHIPALSIPGLRDRAVHVSSISKTFSYTGWRVGYAVAAPALAEAVFRAHQIVTFCLPGPLQHASAAALDLDDDYFEDFRRDTQRKRDLLCDGLRGHGFDVLVPGGSYFCNLDIRALDRGDDLEFCKRLPAEAGVAGVPPSLSWHQRREARHLVRFCYARSDQALSEAVDRLGRWRAALPAP